MATAAERALAAVARLDAAKLMAVEAAAIAAILAAVRAAGG